LIVCELDKWIQVRSCGEKSAIFLNCRPPSRGKLVFGKNKVKRGRISFRRHSGPFPQRIKANIHVLRAVTALLAPRRKNKELISIEADDFFGRLDKNAVPVRVVGLIDLRPMELRTSDESLDQIGWVRKSVLLKVGRGIQLILRESLLRCYASPTPRVITPAT
jgi:hypothetical protein